MEKPSLKSSCIKSGHMLWLGMALFFVLSIAACTDTPREEVIMREAVLAARVESLLAVEATLRATARAESLDAAIAKRHAARAESLRIIKEREDAARKAKHMRAKQFGDLYRSGKALQSTLYSSDFENLCKALHEFNTELLIARDGASSEREREMLRQYSVVYLRYDGIRSFMENDRMLEADVSRGGVGGFLALESMRKLSPLKWQQMEKARVALSHADSLYRSLSAD